jgi:hypothetical protein
MPFPLVVVPLVGQALELSGFVPSTLLLAYCSTVHLLATIEVSCLEVHSFGMYSLGTRNLPI